MFSDGLALLHNSRAGPGHYSAPQNTSKTLFYLGEKVPRGSGDKKVTKVYSYCYGDSGWGQSHPSGGWDTAEGASK